MEKLVFSATVIFRRTAVSRLARSLQQGIVMLPSAARLLTLLALATAACAAPTGEDDQSSAAASAKTDALAALSGTFARPGRSDGGAVAFAESVAGVPVVSARALRLTGLTGDASQQVSLDVRFGKLTRAQFDALTKELGGLSEVPYAAARDYAISDFLPPVVQALEGMDYDATRGITLKGSASARAEGNGDYVVSITPNCHGTAYEIARTYQQHRRSSTVSILYGDALPMGDAYGSSAFTALGNAKPGEDPAALLARLQPGDLLAHYSTSDGERLDLLHSAVYLGAGLVFEKPDSESDENETPYRLATYAQSKSIVQAATGDEPVIFAYRPVALAPSDEAFSFMTIEKELGQQLTAWATKHRSAIAKGLAVEYELGSGGGIRATHATAIDVHALSLSANGRGVLE